MNLWCVVGRQEPLNSGDDVSDEEDNELFDTENVVVCQYDKVRPHLVCELTQSHKAVLPLEVWRSTLWHVVV